MEYARSYALDDMRARGCDDIPLFAIRQKYENIFILYLTSGGFHHIIIMNMNYRSYCSQAIQKYPPTGGTHHAHRYRPTQCHSDHRPHRRRRQDQKASRESGYHGQWRDNRTQFLGWQRRMQGKGRQDRPGPRRVDQNLCCLKMLFD